MDLNDKIKFDHFQDLVNFNKENGSYILPSCNYPRTVTLYLPINMYENHIETHYDV